MLITSDGGVSWTDVTPHIPRSLSPGVIGTAFADAAHAWLALPGSDGSAPTVVLRTTDRGTTWSKTTVASASCGVQLDFLSDTTGFMLLHEGAAAGSEGVILLGTTDAGARWMVLANGNPTPTTPPLIFGGDKSGRAFITPRTGWLTGTWPGSTVLLYVSHDGGKTWGSQTLPVPEGPSAANGAGQSLPPTFFGAAVGAMPVDLVTTAAANVTVFYHTADGGAAWVPTAPIPWSASNRIVYSIVGPNEIVATNGLTVFTTTDGGRKWVRVTPDVNLDQVSEFDFTSLSNGWAIVNGTLLQTQDGGRT